MLRKAFYIRSHLIRMPVPMLARHLWIKWRKGKPHQGRDKLGIAVDDRIGFRASTGWLRKPKEQATTGSPAARAAWTSKIESPTKAAEPPPHCSTIAWIGRGEGLATPSVSPR